LTESKRLDVHGFFQGCFVINAVLERSDLSSNDKIIWAAITQLDSNTIAKTAKICAVSESTVRRSMKTLREKRMIQ